MSKNTPVASYSLTVRVRIANKPGMLGKVTSAIGEAGGDIGAVDLVEAGQKEMTRDIAFKASDEAHGQRIVDRLPEQQIADYVGTEHRYGDQLHQTAVDLADRGGRFLGLERFAER